MNSQCGKIVIVVGHQFITLNVNICGQHGGREALRRAGLSTAAETCLNNVTSLHQLTSESTTIERDVQHRDRRLL